MFQLWTTKCVSYLEAWTQIRVLRGGMATLVELWTATLAATTGTSQYNFIFKRAWNSKVNVYFEEKLLRGTFHLLKFTFPVPALTQRVVTTIGGQ